MAGTLDGTVVDQRNNAPLGGVLLEANGEGQDQQQTSNDQGAFSFSLPAGNYELQASKQGYEPGFYGLVVLDDNSTQILLALQPQMN